MKWRRLFVITAVITSVVMFSCIEETPFDIAVVGNWKCYEVDAWDSIMQRNVCFDCVIEIEQDGNYSMTVKGVVVDSLFGNRNDIGNTYVDRQILFHKESGTWSVELSTHDILLNPNSCEKLNYNAKQLEYVDRKEHRHHVREGHDMDYLQIRDSCLYFPNRNELLIFELNKNVYRHETDSIFT